MLVSVDLIFMLLGCHAGREDVSLADVLHFFIRADKIHFTDMEILPNP